MMIDTGKMYEIDITDLGNSGEGIGRIDGFAVFVHGTIPGDKVRTEIIQMKKSYARGELIEVISPSHLRVKPSCSYSGDCGGCGMQEISYAGQLELKKKWVSDKLERIGGIDSPTVHDVIAMDSPYRYRNKVQFPVGRVSGAEKKERGCNIGFYKIRSHETVNCESCMLQAEPAEVIAGVIRKYVKEMKVPVYDPKSGTGVLRHVIIRTAFGTGEVMVVLAATERRLPGVEWLVEEICDALDGLRNISNEDYYLESLILNVNKSKTGEVMGKENITLAGKPTIMDSLLGMKFEISPLSFYQVNPVQTEKLYKKIEEYAGLTGKETVFDIYCGVGTIGLYLSGNAKKIIGIESVKAAVIDANRNATINGIVNAEYICGKAEEELPKLLGQGVQADVIILDPPRAGCDPELLKAAASAGPSRIIYVSCDPATLARDIKILTSFGYKFIEAQPVDMFPHTMHVETVVLITRVEK